MSALPRSALAGAVALVLAAALAGCATTRMNLEWRNPAIQAAPPAGSAVLVVCRAPDEATRRLCEDQWSNQLARRGVTPMRSYAIVGFPGAAGDDSDEMKAAVRASAAAVVARITLSPGEVVLVNSGPQIGIGIGGGSGGGYRGGSFGFGGIGITVPVGGASTTQGLNASASLIDVATSQLAWSGSASAPASGDLASQVAALAQVTVEAMRKAGLI
jgi:hypothetical protein